MLNPGLSDHACMTPPPEHKKTCRFPAHLIQQQHVGLLHADHGEHDARLLAVRKHGDLWGERVRAGVMLRCNTCTAGIMWSQPVRGVWLIPPASTEMHTPGAAATLWGATHLGGLQAARDAVAPDERAPLVLIAHEPGGGVVGVGGLRGTRMSVGQENGLACLPFPLAQTFLARTSVPPSQPTLKNSSTVFSGSSWSTLCWW